MGISHCQLLISYSCGTYLFAEKFFFQGLRRSFQTYGLVSFFLIIFFRAVCAWTNCCSNPNQPSRVCYGEPTCA